jgi:hypothetical protein
MQCLFPVLLYRAVVQLHADLAGRHPPLLQVTNPNQPGTNVMLVGTISVVVRQATVANAAVTCPGGSARVNLFAGQTVTCECCAPRCRCRLAADQTRFFPSNACGWPVNAAGCDPTKQLQGRWVHLLRRLLPGLPCRHLLCPGAV